MNGNRLKKDQLTRFSLIGRAFESGSAAFGEDALEPYDPRKFRIARGDRQATFSQASGCHCAHASLRFLWGRFAELNFLGFREH
jgi:hypothetical protein